MALHTGQGNSWSNDRYKTMNAEQRKAARDLFDEGEPGFGISACEYMATRDIALTMCDTSANDAQPSGEQGPDFAVPCHTEMQTRRGIWNLENVDTKSLVDKKVLEGAFIWAPLRIIGATGLAGQPGGALLAGQPVEALRVLAEHLAARVLRQRRQPLLQLAHDAERGVDVRIVGGPDEVVGAEVLDHLRGDRLVGIGRDQALAAEVRARLHADGRLVLHDAVLVVEPVEPGRDPVGAGLQHRALAGAGSARTCRRSASG